MAIRFSLHFGQYKPITIIGASVNNVKLFLNFCFVLDNAPESNYNRHCIDLNVYCVSVFTYFLSYRHILLKMGKNKDKLVNYTITNG